MNHWTLPFALSSLLLFLPFSASSEESAHKIRYGDEFTIEFDEAKLDELSKKRARRIRKRRNKKGRFNALRKKKRNALIRRQLARLQANVLAEQESENAYKIFVGNGEDVEMDIDSVLAESKGILTSVFPHKIFMDPAPLKADNDGTSFGRSGGPVLRNIACLNSWAACENGLTNDQFGGYYLSGPQGMKASEAWDRSTGENVVIAIMGTGTQLNHPDLAPNLWSDPRNSFAPGESRHGFNAYGNGAPEEWSTAQMPSVGLGTSIAGITLAKGNNGIGMAGVAYDAKLMTVKVHNTDLSSSRQNYVDGLNYILKKKREGNPVRVVITQWWYGNFPGADTELLSIMNQLNNEGVLIVGTTIQVSGTMENYQSPFTWFPFQYDVDNVITVGAYGHLSQIQSFTANPSIFPTPQTTGPTIVNFHAPARFNVTTVRGSTYTFLIGLGAGAGTTAGAAALLFSEDPTLTPAEVVSLLTNNARTNSAFSGASISGGMLDVAAAMDELSPPRIPGDYNGDGKVDGVDYAVWRNNYGATGEPGIPGDGNMDGRVDAADYTVWRDNFTG